MYPSNIYVYIYNYLMELNMTDLKLFLRDYLHVSLGTHLVSQYLIDVKLPLVFQLPWQRRNSEVVS